MGTLLAFAVVSIGVLILRFTRPNLPRPFRVPLAIVICPLGFLSCMYLFWQPFKEHLLMLVGWIAIGAEVYALYGYRHRHMFNGQADPISTPTHGQVLAPFVDRTHK